MVETKFPVSLFDTGDNVGGGSSADSTFILDELIRQNATGGWSQSPTQPRSSCCEIGHRRRFAMPVGGKSDNLHGKPVSIRGT